MPKMIQIDLDKLLRLFLESHFAYEDTGPLGNEPTGKKYYETNDRHANSGMIDMLYEILEKEFGRDRLIEMLEHKKLLEE